MDLLWPSVPFAHTSGLERDQEAAEAGLLWSLFWARWTPLWMGCGGAQGPDFRVLSADLSALSWATGVVGQVPSPWGRLEEAQPYGLLPGFCLAVHTLPAGLI